MTQNKTHDTRRKKIQDMRRYEKIKRDKTEDTRREKVTEDKEATEDKTTERQKKSVELSRLKNKKKHPQSTKHDETYENISSTDKWYRLSRCRRTSTPEQHLQTSEAPANLGLDWVQWMKESR